MAVLVMLLRTMRADVALDIAAVIAGWERRDGWALVRHDIDRDRQPGIYHATRIEHLGLGTGVTTILDLDAVDMLLFPRFRDELIRDVPTGEYV
jgi:hypothetical protein